MLPVDPATQSGRSATQIPTAVGTSTRWLADVVCYFCGTLQSGCAVVRLSPGRRAPNPRYSVAAGLRWSAGRPHCPRCGGAVFLDDIHAVPISRRESLAAPSVRAAAA